jgi:hypothetical protein
MEADMWKLIWNFSKSLIAFTPVVVSADMWKLIWSFGKGLIVFIPAVASAYAAFQARDAARTIEAIETDRLRHEVVKLNHDAYLDYVKYRREERDKRAGSDDASCLREMAKRDKITDEDLKAMFFEDPGIRFQYRIDDHRGLADCVADQNLKALFKQKEWDKDQTKHVLEELDREFSWQILSLDAALIGYKNLPTFDDKRILCENFGGYLTAGYTDGSMSNLTGRLGDFLERLKDANVVTNGSTPNLLRFMEDISRITQHYTKAIDCKELHEGSTGKASQH